MSSTAPNACSERVAALRTGAVPIVEAGLDELVAEGLAMGRLSFWSDNRAAVLDADIVFLCVPTPQGADGRADMSYVLAAAREIGPHLREHAIVVNKSTVPVGAAAMVSEAIDREDVSVVSNPEFLREGSALYDFLNPDRIVIGSDDPHAAHRVASLYAGVDAEVVVMNAASAELVKYASNGFLAMKITFANSVAELCEDLGADVRDVLGSVGRDSRIGERFLQPGPGLGRFVLPEGHGRAGSDRRRRRPPVHARAGVDGSERVASSMDRRQGDAACRWRPRRRSDHALGRHLQGGHR